MNVLTDAFPTDDFNLADEPWFIEPKDHLPATEFQRQATFVKMMASLAPTADVLAIPNASRASDWERLRRHREGARKGALDLIVTWNRGVAFVEFKDGQKMPFAAQRERLNRYFRMGHHCGVFRRPETAVEWLRGLGCPIRPVNNQSRRP